MVVITGAKQPGGGGGDTPHNLYLVGYIHTISSGKFWKYFGVSDWKVIVVGKISINVRKYYLNTGKLLKNAYLGFIRRKVTEKCCVYKSFYPPCSPTILGKEIRAFFKRLQLLGPSLDEDLAQLPVLKGGAIPIWKRGGRVSENSPTHFKS
jgi:hypothetical protein